MEKKMDLKAAEEEIKRLDKKRSDIADSVRAYFMEHYRGRHYRVMGGCALPIGLRLRADHVFFSPLGYSSFFVELEETEFKSKETFPRVYVDCIQTLLFTEFEQMIANGQLQEIT